MRPGDAVRFRLEGVTTLRSELIGGVGGNPACAGSEIVHLRPILRSRGRARGHARDAREDGDGTDDVMEAFAAHGRLYLEGAADRKRAVLTATLLPVPFQNHPAKNAKSRGRLINWTQSATVVPRFSYVFCGPTSPYRSSLEEVHAEGDRHIPRALETNRLVLRVMAEADRARLD